MTQTRRRLWVASLCLAALVLSPVPSVLASFSQIDMPDRMISHAFGAMSLMCMCLSMILSARPAFIDWAFAGLDKAYVVHKWLGLSAWITLLIHDTLESEVDGLKSEVSLWGVNWHDLGSDMGVWVYNGILVLLAATFLRIIPYRWWYITHRFMIAIFVLSVAHFIVIPKPLALGDWGALYLIVWCTLGLAAGLLSLRPAAMRGGIPYQVEKRETIGDVVSLVLKPTGSRALRHTAGQFAFLRSTAPELQEWHPFTVSCAPQADRSLRMTFAPRERWTRDAASVLNSGNKVYVRGPHGQFFPSKRSDRQIWLSAGVGITPFLAWAQAGAVPNGPVDMIHVCRRREAVPYLSDLEAFAAAHDSVTLKIYETATRGRPTARDVLRLLRDRPERVDLFFCGPNGLRIVLDNAIGLARRARFDLHTEVFELRTDVPLPGWLKRAWRSLVEAAADIQSARKNLAKRSNQS